MGNSATHSSTSFDIAVCQNTRNGDSNLKIYKRRTLVEIQQIGEDSSGNAAPLSYRGNIPSSIDKVHPRLSDLSMKMIPLSDMHKLKSLTGLTELKSLNLWYNDFSSVKHLKVLSGLTRLHSLNLGNCELKVIPPSLLKLTNLKKLNLSFNPNILEESWHSLSALTNLSELDLSECSMTAMPHSFEDLGELKVLDLSSNHKLHSLTPGILNMRSLETLRLGNSPSIRNPPLEVCDQGLPAIRQYYTDLAVGSGLNIPTATIAVIGQKMSGKTSLIWTLQSSEKERILTYRGPNTQLDEATKVFNIEEVKVENTVLRFLDMGGHEVYHLTYQLTLRENCVPVIVVNIEQYKNLSLEVGAREAVRRLYFDWMAHLYLSYPNLGPPTLVITHKDRCSHTEYEELKGSFLSTSDSIRDRILIEEEKLQRNYLKQIKCLARTGCAMFNPESLFEVGSEEDYTTFERIKNKIHLACKEFSKQIPRSWEVIDEEIKSLSGTFVPFEDLLNILSKKHGVTSKQLEVVLTFMHACGKLFWYSNIAALREYVFHNIPRVTKILVVLFHHNGSLIWQQRLNAFESFLSPMQKIVEKGEYEELIENFKKTGMMSSTILFHLLESEVECKTELERTVTLTLLKRFRLLIGPISSAGDDCFMIPYYATGYQDDELGADEMDFKFRVEVYFHGLSLPGYVYHQMTVGLLELFPSESNTHILKHNGATVYSGDANIRLTHDVNSRKTVIELAAKSESIALAWSHIISITTTTINQTLAAWSAVRQECVFYCPHCLLKEEMPPQKKVNPNWCNASSTSSNMLNAPRGDMQSVICGNDRFVPSCLKHPCEEMSLRDQEELKKYFAKEVEAKRAKSQEPQSAEPIIQAKSAETDACSVPSTDDIPSSESTKLTTVPKPKPPPKPKLLPKPQVPPKPVLAAKPKPKPKPQTASILRKDEMEECESDISDGEGYLYPSEDEHKIIIRRRVSPTSKRSVKELFLNTDKVYKMSKSVRGRAMIINNKSFQDSDMIRGGSEVDVTNLLRLFEEMNFKVSEFADLKAKEMHLAIQSETQKEEHDSYGMFILIIMSHGTEKDCVYGTDMKAIDMMDVYDLLSPLKFPQMSGKPKFVAIQACSGARKDFGNQGLHPRSRSERASIVRPDKTSLSSSTRYPVSGRITQLNVDDLFVMKAGFETYQTFRHIRYGTIFIRCLVNTMYQHANHRDLYSLYRIIQERVRKLSIDLAEDNPLSAAGQMVIAFDTFTHRRKLYLFPNYDGPRDHGI